jgi:hypothetical protein
VVFLTSTAYNKNPAHVELRELIRILCSTGEENRRQMLKNKIDKLNKNAPKLAECRNYDDKVSYFSFDV